MIPPLRGTAPSAPRVLTVVAVAIALVVATGCRPPADRASGAATSASDGARQVETRLVEDPPRIGPATVEVEVRHDGQLVEGATVRVTGDMTHAGMVAVVSDAVAAGPGLYRTDDFAFTMAGDWVLSVDVVYPDGVTRQTAVPLSVAR
jgi:hypothetical protein